MTGLWDPFDEMMEFKKRMDRMFEDFWKSQRDLVKAVDIKEPAVDVQNKKNEVVITVDLPGVDKKDIEVNVHQDRIEIKAKVKREKELKKKDYYRKERAYSGFYRAFMLPAIVNPDKAKSTFKNGTLNILLPKLKSLPKRFKRLAIK